jgi:DNA-binding GntR family transcriptional regulator
VSEIEDSLPRLDHPPPLRERVYGALEELIVYGALEPGQHLVETELATRLGVSRLPVREGLQMLHRDGWVDLRPRHGAFVHVPTRAEVHETCEMRTVLEVESARRAAVRADHGSVVVLEEALRCGDAALDGGVERDMINANSRFHRAVAEVAGNRVLEHMIGNLHKRVRWYFAPVARLLRAASWEEHRELVSAIAANDCDAAVRIMAAHTEATLAAYHLEHDPVSL